jgi:hypothetical protein
LVGFTMSLGTDGGIKSPELDRTLTILTSMWSW